MRYADYDPKTVLPTKILRGWRLGVIERRIDRWAKKGYALQGPIRTKTKGRRWEALVVKKPVGVS